MFNLFKRDKKSRRIAIPPHALVQGQYQQISLDELLSAGTTELIEGRRNRNTKYAKALEMTLEDYARALFSDDDLPEAVFLLTQYAKSRGYQVKGTAQQVLDRIYTWSETLP